MRGSIPPCLLFWQDGHVAEGEGDSGATVGGGGGGGPESEFAVDVFSGRASSCYLCLVYRAMCLTRFCLVFVSEEEGGREGRREAVFLR